MRNFLAAVLGFMYATNYYKDLEPKKISYVSVAKVCQECNKFNFGFNYIFKTENKEKYQQKVRTNSKCLSENHLHTAFSI